MKKLVDGELVDMTPEEIAECEAMAELYKDSAVLAEIDSLKAQLAESDYKAIKYAEGWITAEDYAPIKAEREQMRERINALQAQIGEEGAV